MTFFYGFGILIPCLSDILKKACGDSETLSVIFTVLCALCSIVIPYLIGSINSAILISKIRHHEDIRTFGSGNAGSTNMLRTYGKKEGFLTLACDLLKSLLAVVLGYFFFGVFGGPIAGFFVVFGHIFPIFHRFHGGKGVACLAMVVLFESPITFLILFCIFAIIVIGTKFVSLASIMSVLLYPLILNAFVGGFPMTTAMAILTTVFVVFMHRTNIKRLLDGTESKLDFHKSKG